MEVKAAFAKRSESEPVAQEGGPGLGSSVWGRNRGAGAGGPRESFAEERVRDREWDLEQWHLGTRGTDEEQPDGRDSHLEIPEREKFKRWMVNRVNGPQDPAGGGWSQMGHLAIGWSMSDFQTPTSGNSRASAPQQASGQEPRLTHTAECGAAIKNK